MSEKTSHSISNNEVIRSIFEDEHIKEILSTLGLPGLEVLKVEERVHDYNHTSIKFYLIRDGHQNGGKLLVDMSSRQPSLDTLYDTIYGFGADCSGRIILFSEDSAAEDERDLDLIEKMIDDMNQYGMCICFAQVTFGKEGLGIKSVGHPTVVPTSKQKEAPTKERFIEAEFWLRYYGPDYLDDDWSQYEVNFKTEFGEWIWLNGMEVEVHWSEDGAVFIANEEKPDNGYTRTIWEQHIQDIVTAFKGSEVEYSITPGRLPSISVRVWKTPVSDLIGTSELEKKGYGELLYGKFHRFSEMIEGFVWDLTRDKSDVAESVPCESPNYCYMMNDMCEEDH
jgi:hypothetical protein